MIATATALSPRFLPLHALPGGHEGDRKRGTGAGSEARRGTLHGKRILVVEDEAMLAFELQHALEESGATVIGPALSLAEARALFGGHEDIDGAVLDVNLAGQSVLPLAHDLARNGVPILFNTGHAGNAELGTLFPAAEVVAKPTLPEVLADRLAALIGRPRPN